MEKEKTVIGKLLEKIGDFFEGFFNRAEKVWDELSDDVQDAFIQGSEILQIINKNLDKDGGALLILIVKAFPDIDIQKLKEGLFKIITALNLGSELSESPSLEEMLDKLSNYLKTQDKEMWSAITALSSKLIAFSLSGNLISWATLELLMEFVYQNFIKKE